MLPVVVKLSGNVQVAFRARKMLESKGPDAICIGAFSVLER